jgi:hypothetical protein
MPKRSHALLNKDKMVPIAIGKEPVPTTLQPLPAYAVQVEKSSHARSTLSSPIVQMPLSVASPTPMEYLHVKNAQNNQSAAQQLHQRILSALQQD